MTKRKISPSYDPWEAYLDVNQYGTTKLSNIEFTTTTLCNMRCDHCAVGYTLNTKDPNALPMDMIIKRLDEVDKLRCISITGGEPMLSKSSVREYVLPLLKYAHSRRVYTQINSNLTLDYSRYEEIVPYLDVLHISHNWGTIDEFSDVGFARMDRKPTIEQRERYFTRMIENSRALAEQGVMVSAETMLNKRTLPYLEKIHKQVVNEMKCSRHEIHPMYASDFASSLEVLPLDEMRQAIKHLLEIRDENVWMLFGTLPFYPCNDNNEDLELLQKLYKNKNVTVRNDPDGRSRLNVNIFSGDIIVTDFGDTPPLGNIKDHTFDKAYNNWVNSNLNNELNCHCSNVQCLGPNILVKNAYYSEVNFRERTSKL